LRTESLMANCHSISSTILAGAVGIWAWQSDNIVIKFNEVYRIQQLTPPAVMGCDWAAYDFDEGVTNSIYEYNYSHDNGGAAILVYNPGGGNVFRYNVSENDDNQMLGSSGVYAIGIPGGSLSIYNNTARRRRAAENTAAINSGSRALSSPHHRRR
jgi:Right handed beta helix region